MRMPSLLLLLFRSVASVVDDDIVCDDDVNEV